SARYVRLDTAAKGRGRRLFSFLPSERGEKQDRLDRAVVEWPKYRGRVIVFTSSLNADWNDWPRTLSYPPFIQELLRFAVAPATRQTIQAGEPLEGDVPGAFVGLSATVTYDDRSSGETIPVVAQDEAGLVRMPAADRSGVYRLNVGGRHEALFAVNVPVVSPTGGAESDLRRLTAADFKAAAPDADIQVVSDLSEVQHRPATSAAADGEPAAVGARGPAVARVLLFVALGLMLLETFLAWRYGSARAGGAADPMRVRPAWWLTPLWLVPLAVCLVACGVVVHAMTTGEFLGFLPTSV